MAAHLHAQTYQNIQIQKSQSLGIGSYGAVYRAKCDTLLCAAKLLHPILFQDHDPGSVRIMQRFEQECHFLSTIRHPNIVQYLGTCRDPDSGFLVLLMELMDESLTHFLEHSHQPLVYHTEVNLCHDIALALAYLHSSGIIHRDLSSNNVLLIAGSRAKVTDFGMSKVLSVNPHVTPFTFCPGTEVYISPEALKNPPIYTTKLDCFSFGVLEIQMMTRQFPRPGPAMQEVEDQRYRTGTIQVPILDTERRRSHIDLIDATHPLLPTALRCLSYSEEERPSAQDLCQLLAALKETPHYIQSVRQAQERDRLSQSGATDFERQLRDLQEQHEQQTQQIQQLQQQLVAGDTQIQMLQQQLQTSDQQLREKDNMLVSRERENRQLQQANQENQHVIETGQRQQQQLMEQLQRHQQIIQQFQESNHQLTLELEKARHQIEEQQHTTEIASSPGHNQLEQSDQQLQASTQATARYQQNAQQQDLTWEKITDAPEKMIRGAAVSHGKVAYFSSGGTTAVFMYDSEKQQWSTLPRCPHSDFSLVMAKGFLTAVGGQLRSEPTNSLVSLASCREGRGVNWVKFFPPMLTKRHCLAAVCTRSSLITSGGLDGRALQTVEILDIESLQWSTASPLPHSFCYATAVVCEDRIYLMGGCDQPGQRTRSVLSCSIPELLQSCQAHNTVQALASTEQPTVWHKLADTPYYHSTCTNLGGQILAVGGWDRGDTKAIQVYDSTSDSWHPMSDMPTARHRPLVAVLPENKLMVVGGWGTRKWGWLWTEPTKLMTVEISNYASS